MDDLQFKKLPIVSTGKFTIFQSVRRSAKEAMTLVNNEAAAFSTLKILNFGDQGANWNISHTKASPFKHAFILISLRYVTSSLIMVNRLTGRVNQKFFIYLFQGKIRHLSELAAPQ
ncbi:MAG: hypothetical protein Q8N13_22825 [Acidovorax sp.]|nr:hypothetical protein [Acidovorax sp.]